MGYGKEALEWLAYFSERGLAVLEDSVLTLDAVKNEDLDILDTTSGTQFRSLEHGTPIHAFLLTNPEIANQVFGVRGKTAKIAGFDIGTYQNQGVEITTAGDRSGLVIPPDEFNNGRIIILESLYREALDRGEIYVPEISSDRPIPVGTDINDKSAEDLALWPSSNRVPNSDLVVANFTYPWKDGEEGGFSDRIRDHAGNLTERIGTALDISFEAPSNRTFAVVKAEEAVA